MKAADIMTRRLYSVRPEQSVADAIDVMLGAQISGLPVIDADDALVGIVTEGDFLRRVETGTERRRPRWLEFLRGPGRLAGEFVHAHGRKVNEVMTSDVATVSPDTSLSEVVALMERKRIKRIPVVKEKKVVGIISRANLLRAVASADRVLTDAPGDGEIRDRILADIQHASWGPCTSVNVFVHDGIVELRGAIFDEREREALHVIAENTPGVKKVCDHVVWVEPASGVSLPAPDDARPSLYL